MKKIFAISIVFLAVYSSICFADEGETDMSAPAPASVAEEVVAPMSAPVAQAPVTAGKRVIKEMTLESADPNFVVGTVAEVYPSGLGRPIAKIVIVDANGERIEFPVRPLAVIYDSTGAIFAIDQLREHAKVQVNFRTRRDGVREATSIKIAG